MEQVLTFYCPDKIGIQAKVTNLLFHNEAFLTDVESFSDSKSHLFFSRVVFTSNKILNIKKDFKVLSKELNMQYEFNNLSKKIKVGILVSKEGHCLNDLIYRSNYRGLNIEVVCIISNHKNLRPLSKINKTPFLYVDTDKYNNKESELIINNELKSKNVELVILARYMQIMTPTFVKDWQNKCINIHHSFLPSFKGAKPYHQAFERGVKMIGASAHYISNKLDEGPIIEQGAEEISHKDSVDSLISKGNDIEARVLSKAVTYHAQHRVFLNGAKTIVFR
jgi:formyltetrahydrofolate deformylase